MFTTHEESGLAASCQEFDLLDPEGITPELASANWYPLWNYEPRADLNHRPPGSTPGALPAELLEL